MLLDKDLIELNVKLEDKDELLRYMGEKLLIKNIVKGTYPEAVVMREKEFPTGISSKNIGIAIPHTVAEHVNEPKVAISILKKPIEFQMMGEPNVKVQVSLVIMIAINNPDLQIDFLQKLVSIIEDHDLLLQIKNAESIDEVYELLSFLNKIK
ncbi:MAG: PTS sugar transporter subunit IIA [Sebaldella sp.]|nr:PTS sugar transporter subunit IIA [Sebaldella sp.]